MELNKTKSGIVLPSDMKTEEKKKDTFRMKGVQFPFIGELFDMEIADSEGFLDTTVENRTIATAKELRSYFNLGNLLCLAIAKDMKAAGLEISNFRKLTETTGLSVFTKEGKTLKIIEEVDKPMVN